MTIFKNYLKRKVKHSGVVQTCGQFQVSPKELYFVCILRLVRLVSFISRQNQKQLRVRISTIQPL